MSAQTHTPSLPPPPPSVRGTARLSATVARWRSEPNPVWLREMRQSARLTRTPFILMTVTSLTALLLCTIGGLMTSAGGSSLSPAVTGAALYHTFFSIAFFVVTLAGAAVAANGIASEREGRTWEALLLTGLPPGTVARGKFLAAYTSVSLYVVMMAPVGALPFLFGGVTPAEVVIAFAWLFLFAGLSVAFGLAISSRMESLRASIIVTMFAALCIVPTIYVVFGPMMSAVAGEIWPQVPKGPPVWLPTAYERAPFGLPYLGCLVFAPLLLVGLPAWFLYEVTVANLTSVTDDRSSGVRVWFLVASMLLALGGAMLPASVMPGERISMTLLAGSLYLLFLVFCAFVFAGEPIGPSRRVHLQWDRAGAGGLRRALGPGVVPASITLLLAGSAGLGLVALVGGLSLAASGLTAWRAELHALAVAVGYAEAFFVFVVGFSAWMRARSNSPGTTRTMLLVVLFIAFAGPWIVAAIAGAMASAGDEGLIVAAPSPIYALVAAGQLQRGMGNVRATTLACAVSSAAWLLLGLGLFGRAAARCRAVIRAHEAALAESDALLQAEDEAAAGGEPPGEGEPAPAHQAAAPPGG